MCVQHFTDKSLNIFKNIRIIQAVYKSCLLEDYPFTWKSQIWRQALNLFIIRIIYIAQHRRFVNSVFSITGQIAQCRVLFAVSSGLHLNWFYRSVMFNKEINLPRFNVSRSNKEEIHEHEVPVRRNSHTQRFKIYFCHFC